MLNFTLKYRGNILKKYICLVKSVTAYVYYEKVSFILLRPFLVPQTTNNREVTYMEFVDKFDFVNR